MFTDSLLKGKNVLLTGAGGGIGKSITELLVKAGAKVIGTGTQEAKLEDLAKTLPQKQFLYFTADLDNSEQVENMYARAESLVEKIDILICNAGITRDNLTLRMKEEEWSKVININLTSVFKLNQAACKKMMKHRSGVIVNISSVIGFTGNLGQVNYSAAKAGMIGMSKSIALEVANFGIRVNCIAPGFIKTPMTEKLTEAQQSAIISRVPLARMGTPADVANAALFLASDASSYMTGSTLHVNGGLYMA